MSLLAAAPVAPAAPAAGITGALILLAFVWVVLYGTLRGYDASFGAFLRVLAGAVEDIWLVGGKLADILRGLDNRVRRLIGFGLEEVEEGMARLWAGLEWVVRETVDAVLSFGADTYYSIENIVESQIPAAVGAGTRPLKDSLQVFRDQLRKVVEAELARFRRGIDAVERDVLRDRLAAQRGIDYLGDITLGNVIPRVKALERALADVVGYTRRNLRIRIGRLERYALGAAATAVGIAALTRVFPYWQCTNVRRFNRTLCRLPVGLLDDLLGGALALLVLSDVCRIGALTREVAELAQPALLAVVGVVDAATDCTSFPKPAGLPLAAAELPASENLAPL